MDHFLSELQATRREVRLLRVIGVVSILLWILASPFSAHSADETEPVGTSLKLPVRILNEKGRLVLQVREKYETVYLEQFDPSGNECISLSSSQYGGHVVVSGKEKGAVTISGLPEGGQVQLFKNDYDRAVLQLNVVGQMGQVYVGRSQGYPPYALLGATDREGGFLQLGGHRWDGVSIDGSRGKYKMRIYKRPAKKK